MSDIGKGDWVEALYDFDILPIKTGSVLFVEDIASFVESCPYCGTENAGLYFVGLPHVVGHHDGGCCPCSFRPLRKPPETGVKSARRVEIKA